MERSPNHKLSQRWPTLNLFTAAHLVGMCRCIVTATAGFVIYKMLKLDVQRIRHGWPSASTPLFAQG